MPSAAKAPPIFELRSASVTLLSLVLRSASIDTLAAAMDTQFGDTADMFEDDPLVVDISALDGGAVLDFERLRSMLRERRLLAIAVRGGSDAQRTAASATGLADVGEASGAADAAVRIVEPIPTPEAQADAPPTPAAAAAPSAEPAAPPAALIIDRPLRSGQQVYARGGDLVVLAAVNFGAEVIADGNIHVYGPLRGKAIAGAKGDTAARIFSTCMEPELLAIAGTYRTTENPLPPEVVGKPAQVRLDGERLVFEALS